MCNWFEIVQQAFRAGDWQVAYDLIEENIDEMKVVAVSTYNYASGELNYDTDRKFALGALSLLLNTAHRLRKTWYNPRLLLRKDGSKVCVCFNPEYPRGFDPTESEEDAAAYVNMPTVEISSTGFLVSF